jgi:hypothetical protein
VLVRTDASSGTHEFVEWLHARTTAVHRRWARADDRIRAAKATWLTNLPLHGYARNRIWVALAAIELTAWTQMLALAGHEARRCEPKRLRLRRSPSPAASPVTPGRSTSG